MGYVEEASSIDHAKYHTISANLRTPPTSRMVVSMISSRRDKKISAARRMIAARSRGGVLLHDG
jgi:hypothetical protein